jgi:hypothetical protein
MFLNNITYVLEKAKDILIKAAWKKISLPQLVAKRGI